jgi:hypothetical protein
MPFLKTNPVSLEQKRYLVGYDERAFLAAYSTSLLGKRHSFAAFWDSINFKDARSFAWREKLYSHGFFDRLVHFICGHEDDYFTRYNKATLVRDH